ncbi:MAG TPA: hypothetical protein VFE46_09290 [Pirellulales bacterium]|jgi:hypothetical protein|nr:hypothetical protein [Pirellulales bacterium]
MSPNAATHKMVSDSPNFWELPAESEIQGITIPEQPTAAGPTTVRITHSNSYGPFDEAEIFVRIGDPNNPTDQDDVQSHADWVPAKLVEELVFVDDDYIPRDQAEEPFEDETQWCATYEAELKIPAGPRSIEIKLVSHNPELLPSLVLSGWDFTVA